MSRGWELVESMEKSFPRVSGDEPAAGALVTIQR